MARIRSSKVPKPAPHETEQRGPFLLAPPSGALPSAGFQEAPGPLQPSPSMKLLARLIGRGTSLEDALETLHLTNECANSWMHTPEWLPLVREAMTTDEEVDTQLQVLVPTALAVKEKLLRDSEIDPRLRNDIADDILDRRGYRATERKEVAVVVISPERISSIRNSLLQGRAILADATVEE